MSEKYKSKDWLIQKYWKEKLTEKEISSIIDCSPTTIHRWLKNFGISRRKAFRRGGKYRNKDWLEKKYLEERLSTHEIGSECNVDRSTIGRWLKKFDIKRRMGNWKRLKHVEISKELRVFIEGLLLGDGCLAQHRNKPSASYQHADKHLDFIKWLEKIFLSFSIKQSGSILIDDGGVHHYRSRSYVEFLDLKKEWYSAEGKRIPTSFEINPTKLFLWFIGDGNYCYKGKSPSLRIKAETLESDLSLVISQLRGLGLVCSKNTNGLYIWKESQKDFFEYILKSPYRPPAYHYKFPEEYRDEFPD